MLKTPAALLNEISVYLDSAILYEITDSKLGPSINSFTCRITCKGLSASGHGPSKKDAKQDAAQNFLKLLLESDLLSKKVLSMLPEGILSTECPAPVNPGTSNDSDSNGPFINYVGQLNEQCVKQSLPDPVFNFIGYGPAQDTSFIISCRVSSLYEEGSASTKKGAKQKAAKNMLKKLLESPEVTDKLGPLEQLSVAIQNFNLEPVAKKKFETSSVAQRYKEQARKCTNTEDFPVCEHHLKLTNFFSKLSPEKRAKIQMIQKASRHEISTLKDTFSMIFDNPIELINFSVLKNQQYLIGFRFAFQPTLLQIGIGNSRAEAEEQALCKLINSIALFMTD